MQIVGSKRVIEELSAKLLKDAPSLSEEALALLIRRTVLSKKVRFQALEHFAALLYKTISIKRQIKHLDEIARLNEVGGNVILGKILQLRLENHFKESLKKAQEYIIDGDEWFVCDIISERVMGYALLRWPEETLPILKKFSKQSNHWIVRSVGAATHYAVKKGLPKTHSEHSFLILLSCASVHHPDIKKGIGWAAKTVAKFHPDIVSKYRSEIDTDPEIKQWFKTKLNIGLSRSFKYAPKYPG